MFNRCNWQTLRFFFFISFLLSPSLLSQVDSITQRYRDDLYGNPIYRRQAIINGNLVRTLFKNDGQIGTWPERPSGEWPVGSGHNYLDGGTPIVSARVETPAGAIHPAETSYREEVDQDPVTGLLWVMNPLPGYSNPNSTKPAMSNDSLSWPEKWPAALNLPDDWNGHWYGYFGKDVFNSDLEIFYVLDDTQDKEFTRTPYEYFPITSDSNRGGLGLRVEVRGFQWSNLAIEDIVFWHYDVINISDYNYDSTAFGFYWDSGVGDLSDSYDDMASYDKKLDIAYSYDYDGIAIQDNWITGYVGYSFLESPGNALNGIDDDEDSMIDERRDDGIDNDGDWIAYTDVNNNGKWDASENEPLNNDVGQDGIGISDSVYSGPDLGEGDGIPTNGEPNFDKTDKDESDQIGLTSFAIEVIYNKGPLSLWPKNDEVIWNRLMHENTDTLIQNANIQVMFGSGSFPLMMNKRERFSVALVFGNDLDDLILNKNFAQSFYNNNYLSPDSVTEVNENNLSGDLYDFELEQNHPNPFNPSTKIRYQIPQDGIVTLKIYDILGAEVATLVNEEKVAGKYEVNFSTTGGATSLASGVYIYKIQAGEFVSSKKMMMIK
jgi:hypothetical protein